MHQLVTPLAVQFFLALSLATLTAAPARSASPSADAKPVAPGTCLSRDETELARLVQEYRKAHGLPPIPLSKSLSLAAQWHAFDLEKNAPANQTNERGEPCGLQSWSSRGPWKGFCYTPDHKEAKKVWEKPNELTGGKYPGMGFESVYYNADGILPFRALDYWKVRPEENGILLETSPWPQMKWPAMGVAINEHYAVLWFGTETDPLGTITRCGSPPPPSSSPKPQKGATPPRP